MDEAGLRGNFFIRGRGAFLALLSTLMLILTALSSTAHEVSPSVADLSSSDGVITLELRVNLEAFVAGIDLDGVTDTNETAQAADYDTLRALEPATLEGKLTAAWPDISRGFKLSADDMPLTLELISVRVDPVGDVELPRPSFLTLRAVPPSGTQTVSFGWEARFGTLVLRQNGVEDGYTGYLINGQISPPIAMQGGVQASGLATFAEYIPIGFDHILPKGLDHILFVLGLFLLSIHLRPLLWQVTTFTLAHTVTLALGAMGWVTVSPAIVEPLIAASICYVAIENTFTSKLNPWRPFIIFGFGLLHGLGFASVLGDVGLPDAQFFPALIGFNVGVEFGQLAVITLAFLAVGLWFRNKPWYRARISIPASVFIAIVAAYWTFERVFL